VFLFMCDLASGYSQGGRKSSLGVSRLHGQVPFSNARSYFRILVNNMQKKKEKKSECFGELLIKQP
jgi:hypothetical protein